jgi:hypothetical protein
VLKDSNDKQELGMLNLNNLPKSQFNSHHKDDSLKKSDEEHIERFNSPQGINTT